MANRDHASPAKRSRRQVLRGLAGVAGLGFVGVGSGGALSGCGIFGAGDAGLEAHALEPFLAATVALGDYHDAALAAHSVLAPTLTPVRDAHRAHANALASALGREVPPAPSTGSVPADRTQALAALANAEKKAQDDAVAACLANAPRLAALLGSIAAARASHQEILR